MSPGLEARSGEEVWGSRGCYPAVGGFGAGSGGARGGWDEVGDSRGKKRGGRGREGGLGDPAWGAPGGFGEAARLSGGRNFYRRGFVEWQGISERRSSASPLPEVQRVVWAPVHPLQGAGFHHRPPGREPAPLGLGCLRCP